MNENEINKKKSAKAEASLTLGIVSIVTAWFWYITIPAGILAIIFGTKAVRAFGSKLGKAGIITGIVGLSLFLLSYIGVILMYVAVNL